MYFASLYIVCVVTACTPKVHVDRDESANMASYKTYKFVDNRDDSANETDANPLYHSSLLDNSIHAEIAMQLEKRGLTESNKSPDVLVAYHTYTEKKLGSVNNYYPMMYGGWGWRYYPMGYAAYPFGYWNGYNSTYEYTEGTLIIDIINAKTKLLVWRGSVSDAIDDPANLHRKASAAVKQIFKKYPS